MDKYMKKYRYLHYRCHLWDLSISKQGKTYDITAENIPNIDNLYESISQKYSCYVTLHQWI